MMRINLALLDWVKLLTTTQQLIYYCIIIKQNENVGRAYKLYPQGYSEAGERNVPFGLTL